MYPTLQLLSGILPISLLYGTKTGYKVLQKREISREKLFQWTITACLVVTSCRNNLTAITGPTSKKNAFNILLFQSPRKYQTPYIIMKNDSS